MANANMSLTATDIPIATLNYTLTYRDDKRGKNEIEKEREREKKITDNSRCLQSLSFRVVFMANLTWTPLTYLNGGKDAPLRAKARLRSRLSRYIARETMLMPGSLMLSSSFFFWSSCVTRCPGNGAIPH